MQFIVNLLKGAGLSNLESSYRPRNGESQEKLGAKKNKKQGYLSQVIFLIDRARDSSPRCSHEWREMQVSLFPGSPVKLERFSLLSFFLGWTRYLAFLDSSRSLIFHEIPFLLFSSYSCLQSISDNRKGSIRRAISWNGTRAFRAFLRGYGIKNFMWKN